MHASHGSGEIRSLSRVLWANGLLEIGVIFIAIQWLVIGWMCQIGQSDNYMCGLAPMHNVLSHSIVNIL